MMAQSAKTLLTSCIAMAACVDGQAELDQPGTPRSAAHTNDLCRVQLHDTTNDFFANINAESSKQGSALSFIITDEGPQEDFAEGEVTVIEAYFERRYWPLETSVSVPNDTLNEIRQRYQTSVTIFATQGVVSPDNLEGFPVFYALLPGAECTRDEFAMIEFFVDEWLYYG